MQEQTQKKDGQAAKSSRDPRDRPIDQENIGTDPGGNPPPDDDPPPPYGGPRGGGGKSGRD